MRSAHHDEAVNLAVTQLCDILVQHRVNQRIETLLDDLGHASPEQPRAVALAAAVAKHALAVLIHQHDGGTVRGEFYDAVRRQMLSAPLVPMPVRDGDVSVLVAALQHGRERMLEQERLFHAVGSDVLGWRLDELKWRLEEARRKRNQYWKGSFCDYVSDLFTPV